MQSRASTTRTRPASLNAVRPTRGAVVGYTAHALELQRAIGNRAFAHLLSQTGGQLLLQRTVNWAALEKTKKDGEYAVHVQGDTTLYGKAKATPPLPTALYAHGADVDEKGKLVQMWTPNVKFLQKDQTKEPEGETEEKGEKENEKEEKGEKEEVGLADWQKQALSDVERFELALQQQIVGTITSTTARQQPKMGVIGLNDCVNWAKKLRRLIAEEKLRNKKLKQPKKAAEAEKFDFQNKPKKVPKVKVGDTMVQQLFGSGSNYHGATVVAKDTKTVVTLEAHVEKQLESPVFHFYDGGVSGFVDANNEGDKWREANKVGQGSVEHLEVPTAGFYSDLNDQINYYLDVLKESPDDFEAQVKILQAFKDVVQKPTTRDGDVF